MQANSAGELEVGFAGVRVTVSGSGPFEGGLALDVFARANSTLASSSGLEPGSVRVSELRWAADRATSSDDDAAIAEFLVVLVHHLASGLFADVLRSVPMPTLSMPLELRVGSMVFGTGFPAGTRIVTANPTYLVGAGRIEAIGTLGTR
jgi:hypothetical protein